MLPVLLPGELHCIPSRESILGSRVQVPAAPPNHPKAARLTLLVLPVRHKYVPTVQDRRSLLALFMPIDPADCDDEYPTADEESEPERHLEEREDQAADGMLPEAGDTCQWAAEGAELAARGRLVSTMLQMPQHK